MTRRTAMLCGAAIVAVVAFVILAMWDPARPPAAQGRGVLIRKETLEAPGSRPSSRPTTQAIRPRAFEAAESGPAVPSRPESRDPGSSTMIVRVIWGDDKTPAVGVGVHVVEWGTRSGVWKLRDPVTGPDGMVKLEGVAPGKVGFYLDRGGGETVDVAGGQQKEVVLEVPPGANLEGDVIDPDGKPVAGADVWLSTAGNRDQGVIVTQTDEKGAFRLRSVSPIRWVAARARTHAPSPGVEVPRGRSGEVVKVRLVLAGKPGTLRGIVTGPDGSPASGATVRIEPRGYGPGPQSTFPPPFVLSSGGDGSFHVEGLPAGTNPIAVRLAGFAPWSGMVEIDPAEERRLDVRLRRQAVVFGTATLESGAPAGGAMVGVGRYGDFLFSMTTTATDGSFRLDSLAPGTMEIRASLREVGKAAATLVCAEGEEVRWDPVIDAGLRISGVVRDDGGRPLAGWTLNAHPMKDEQSWWGQAKTGADGRFNIVNCPAHATFRVDVLEPGKFVGDAVKATLEEVAPGDRTIVISTKSLAVVKGRIVGPDGKAVRASTRLSPNRNIGSFTVESDETTGAFATSPFLPGRWRITVSRKTPGILDLGDRDLTGGVEVDLGDVRLAEPGRLAIQLGGAEGVAERVSWEIRQELAAAPGQPRVAGASLRFTDRDLPRPLELGPGSWSVELSGPGLAPWHETVDIVAGQEKRVSVAAEAAGK